MPQVVDGADVLEAWKNGAQAILDADGHILRNLITEISDPTKIDQGWYARFNPQTVGASDSMSVVAKVLFPARVRSPDQTRQAYYDLNSERLERALRAGALHSSWRGTYFQRLMSLDGSANQVERAIGALSTWQVRSETAIVMHLSSPAKDGLRKRGSPCLQFVEILWGREGLLDLVAVYRNHDFLNKALGNFVGLGRLLAFLAGESGKQPGKVICHSVRAYAESVGKLKLLVAR
jgi:thymidylate synthase